MDAEGPVGTKQPVKPGSDGCEKINGQGPASNSSTSFPGSKGQGHIRSSEGNTGS